MYLLSLCVYRWFGITGIIGGEVGNLIAYGYAPAAIVTPIGAIGVLTNVLITTLFLKERIRKLNVLGMCAVVGGIVMTVYFAPKTEAVFSSDSFWSDVISTKFGISYFITFALSAVVMMSINRYFGDRSVVIPVLTSSIFGSLTILSAKTFSSLLTRAISEGFDKYFLSPVPYLALLLMIGTCIITMAFINTAMIKFGNCQVVPTYYALFTTLSVASVGWVFREFECLTVARDAGLFVAGILLAICGVSLVQVRMPCSRLCIMQRCTTDSSLNQLLPGSVAVELEETSEPDPAEPTPTLKPESRPPPTAPDHVSMHPGPPGPVRPSVVAAQSHPGESMPPPSPQRERQRLVHESAATAQSSALAPAGPLSSLQNDNATPPHHGPPPPAGSVAAQSRPDGSIKPPPGLRLLPLNRGSGSQASDPPALPGTTLNDIRTRASTVHPPASDRPGGGADGGPQRDSQVDDQGLADQRSARRRLRTLRPLPHGVDGRAPTLPRESLT
jgi:drug/metabolite transporter (DMT)-like permease